ncbi:MAG: DNA-processing protein DprA [Oscillospiraceae bacterium]|nr:DNA-processing protein DprA [Oscillospiraceae bacterium]
MAGNVYHIWMQLLFGIGSRRPHDVAEGCECPQELFETGASGGAALTAEEKARSKAAMVKARRIEEATLRKRVDIITPEHPDYPELLIGTYARPMVLYVKGSLACLKTSLAIAMVGTRKYSEYGEACARDLAQGLSKAGCVIISGLAQGIDSICHAAAIEKGGLTVGVMGCGLDVDYPPKSAPLKTLMKRQGAVISEYPLGYHADKFTFPVRNRVIAGMSRGTVVVEAPARSGSLITARLALDAGRDVFAVPGSIYSTGHGGGHKLLKEGGAKLVACAGDILEEYPEYARMHKTPRTGIPKVKAVTAKPEAALKPDLPNDVRELLRQVYGHIDENPKTSDVIAGRIPAEIGDVMGSLTELEIMGFVKSHPGGFFSI